METQIATYQHRKYTLLLKIENNKLYSSNVSLDNGLFYQVDSILPYEKTKWSEVLIPVYGKELTESILESITIYTGDFIA